SMDAPVIVVTDESVYLSIGLLKSFKAMSKVAFSFKNAMERFDVRIHIGCLIRDAFVLHIHSLTVCMKVFTQKLRTIIRADHKILLLWIYTTFKDSLL